MLRAVCIRQESAKALPRLLFCTPDSAIHSYIINHFTSYIHIHPQYYTRGHQTHCNVPRDQQSPSSAASRSKTSRRPKHAGIPKNSSAATSCYTASIQILVNGRLWQFTDTTLKCDQDFKRDQVLENKKKLKSGKKTGCVSEMNSIRATHQLEVQVPCDKYKPRISWRSHGFGDKSSKVYQGLFTTGYRTKIFIRFSRFPGFR